MRLEEAATAAGPEFTQAGVLFPTLLGLPNPGTPLAKCCKILAGSSGSSPHPGDVCQGVQRQEGKGPCLPYTENSASSQPGGLASDRPDSVGSQALLVNQLARARLRERLAWHNTKPRSGAQGQGYETGARCAYLG